MEAAGAERTLGEGFALFPQIYVTLPPTSSLQAPAWQDLSESGDRAKWAEQEHVRKVGARESRVQEDQGG